jgi:transcriptional regulator with XRE-family HTH domain
MQSQNKDAFQQAQDKMKKGETKPMAKALRAKGMSQQELADKLNVHKSTISRLKTGKRNPSFEMMSELGDALGSVENLFPELK